MTVLFYQINRQTAALHKEVLSERINVSDFANDTDAKNYAEFKAKKAAESGYHVNVTYFNNDGKWSFLKKY